MSHVSLSASETASRMRAVLDALPDYAAYVGPDHRYRFSNAAYRNLFDLDPDSIAGQHVRDMLGEQGYAFSKPNLDRAFAGETVEIESLVLIEGAAPRLLVRYVPEVGDDGQVRGVIVHARDVTAQRAAEAELARSRQRLDAQVDVLFRYAPVVLWATDPDGVITHSEGRGLAKLGLKQGELTGSNIFETYADSPDITKPIRAVLSGDQDELTFRSRVGPRCFENYVAVIPAADEEAPTGGLVGVAVDVTEREAANAERERVAGELRRRNTELEEFAYVASHDLQEPLRTIISFIELMQRRNPEAFQDPDSAEYLAFITDAATRMRALIGDLLSYSRIGREDSADSLVDVTRVLESVRADLGATAVEAEAIIHIDGTLPSVEGKPSQISIVFRNLISNAIKFQPDGQAPRIEVSSERVAETLTPTGGVGGPGWRFSVEDNGIGIGEDHLDRVFLVFKRLHARDRYPGTGIGLAACKKIIENRGGRIWAESAPGHGTTFYFDWPDERS